MHCPYCGTLNDAQPRYCRKCGRSLTAVQLALAGRVDEAIAKFRKSQDLLVMGLFAFAICMFAAFILLGSRGPLLFSFVVILALLVSVPLVLTGLIKLNRVRRLLDAADTKSKQITSGNAADTALPGRSTDPLEFVPEPRGSVTDRTTLHLDQHKPTEE